jgi:Fe-S cluster biogenesis protein NfuA/nitrite reductase/ring-hydroxylating ferredoxin subunit
MEAAATIPAEGPEELMARVQDLQSRLDASGDAATRQVAEELVSAVVQMHGVGLERILSLLFAAGDDGERIAMALAEDPLVATLLLIHDLHPVPLADRVQGALEHVRPYMESHGGDVELLSLEDGVARIRLEGSCSDCSASSVTLELAIKQALEEAAPDLEGLEVEGVAPQATGLALRTAEPSGNALELPIVMSSPPPAPPAWFELDAAVDLRGGTLVANIAGHSLLVANVEGTLLAYRNSCADCGRALEGGALSGGTLTCPHCERMYFLPRAGRSMDDDHLQLEPVPLLRELGSVKVALTP